MQKYTGICFQSASRKQFLSVRKLCSANVFFMTPNRNIFAGKFVNWERFLVVFGSKLFSMVKELTFVK